MSTVGKPIDYTGHIVRNVGGRSHYHVIGRDPFGGYILQSVRSREKVVRLERGTLDEHWEVER